MRPWTGLAALLIALGLHPLAAAAADQTRACEALAGRALKSTTVATASVVPATADVPAYCRITGDTAPSIRFEARFPVTAWNGKFFQAGCGGFCGDFNPDKPGYSNTIGEAVRHGYAAIMADYGHRGTLADASWAVGNEEAVALYAEKGIPLVHDTGHALIKALYNKNPKRSYFAGCSNGGRQGLVAAQRYPKLFNGILAGGAVLNLTRNGGLYGTWLLRQNTAPDGSAIIGPAFAAKLPRLRAEVLRQCAAVLDPQKVVLTDPRACTFDVAQLPHCAAGQNTAECFTDAERRTLAAWYGGPKNSAGQSLTSGTPLGSEPYWPVWLTGTANSRAVGLDLGRDYMKLAFAPNSGPPVDAMSFDYDRDPPRLDSRAMFDAKNPDLSAFAAAGGKLIMYHGWADPVVLPTSAVNYYDEAIERNGGLARLQSFARLFMIAGAGHCWEMPAPAPDQFDPIAALDAWVEKGVAPEAIPIVQPGKDGAIQRRAVLRPYPQAEAFDPL